MELEDKAKAVTSVWGAKFAQFLDALAVLPWSIWKKRLNSSFSFKSTEVKQLTRQGIEHILPPKQMRRPFALSSNSILRLWIALLLGMQPMHFWLEPEQIFRLRLLLFEFKKSHFYDSFHKNNLRHSLFWLFTSLHIGCKTNFCPIATEFWSKLGFGISKP